MALPNFRLYYWAANICCATFWSFFHGQPKCPNWVAMELSSTKELSISALLGSALPSSLSRLIANPLVRHTLRKWAQFRKCYGFHGFSVSSPVVHNHLFLPTMYDTAFQVWFRKGIRRFEDLFIDNRFASFQQLSVQFNLPNAHFFRYLQIRHFIAPLIPNFPEMPAKNAMDLFLSINPLGKGLISIIQDKLAALRRAPVDKIKMAWEHDLNTSLSDESWDSILKSVNSTSLCARHCLLQFKIVHRAHMSKSKLSRFYPDISPLCDKCKRGEASRIHMYWFCHSLEKFWKDVFTTLSYILNQHLEPNPLIALFDFWGETDLHLSPTKCRILSFASLLARRLILLR
ncbi:uncharacterized protein LOC132400604 [Hypanus sabinus]|uniref:uncharacterized protein LOC132400604 n=1 Tax=Hypanus sabinus TaxID=79690 RepID=UPI0028C409DB|nr:uncharacterized protein LOC132400604 [Hypanus sabinus]